MHNRFGLLVADVMPIYMIMHRYSHNYALFYQLLDSNLLTHRNTYAILRGATSETYVPGSIFYHISFQSTFICIFTFFIYIIKYQKYMYLIILSLSDLTFASDRVGIDNPLSHWLRGFICLCRCVGLLRSLLLD